MREYGQVQCSYWRDPDIKALAGRARELGVYLLTGPHSNGIGCYYLPDGYLMADLGWDAATIRQGFDELFRIGFAKRCAETDFVLIPKFLFWNEIANGNVAKARAKEFETVPKRSTVFRGLCDSLERFGNHWPKGFDKVLEEGRNQNPTLPESNQTRKDPPPAGGEVQPPAEQQRQPAVKKVHGTPEDHALAKHMLERIRVVAPSAKEPSWDGWANAIRLMREQDGRTLDEIRGLFDWANADSFWRANILSPANLREKWTQLEAKRRSRGAGGPAPAADPTAGVGDDGSF